MPQMICTLIILVYLGVPCTAVQEVRHPASAFARSRSRVLTRISDIVSDSFLRLLQVVYADNSKSFMTFLNDETVSDIVMTGDTLACDLTDVIKVFRFCLLDNDALILQEISH